jgi:hypothetical protein
MDLFNLFLSLMNEQQLRWDILSILRSVVHRPCLLVILFDSEIPKRHLIIRPGRSKDRILRRMPFDGCDGRSMPREGCDRRRFRCGGPS